ncbi:GGDEF domain-containing protein [Mycobacterium sp. SA01]|uniref:GGDEF domain-containing protein n=1 Tax=Mycobacterium sp. SA01 TaxID=3238820 RepID=UPI00351BB94F
MEVANEWLGILALAGVPAFVCRLDQGSAEVQSRTPKFVAIRDALNLDENVVLDRLAAACSAAAGPDPIIVDGESDPAWQCVVTSVNGNPNLCLAILRVTSRLQRYNETFFSIVEKLPDIVSRYDRNFRHLYVNPAIESVTPLIGVQDYIGKDHHELGMPPHLIELWQSAYRRAFEAGETVEQEFTFLGPHGTRHFLFRTVPEYGPDGKIHTVLNTARDITELKSLQQQLEVLGQTDPLTSLLNRRGFINRLEAELRRARDGGAVLSLLMLDINNFKSVNDTFGHPAGDDVLTAIGDIIQTAVQPDDFPARLGGDEFCIGLVDTSSTQARAAAERIRMRISELGALDGCPCRITVSIGLVTSDEPSDTASDLLSRCDRSMYQEKLRRSSGRP